MAEEIAVQLTDKGFINITGNLVSLTNKGREQHLACFVRQTEFRQTATKNISPEDYQKTVQTLQNMANNLETIT